MASPLKRDPLLHMVLEDAFGTIEAKLPVRMPDWKALLLSDGHVTATWVASVAQCFSQLESTLRQDDSSVELRALNAREHELVTKRGQLSEGWPAFWDASRSRRDLAEQIQAAEAAVEELETELRIRKRPKVLGKKHYDTWRRAQEQMLEEARSSLVEHEYGLGSLEDSAKANWLELTQALPQLLKDIERTRGDIANVVARREEREQELREVLERMSVAFVMILHLALEPLSKLPEASSDQRDFVLSLGASGFVEFLVGKHCPTIHATAIARNLKEYGRAMLLLAQTYSAFYTGNPQVVVNGKTEFCSLLLSAPVREMLDVPSIPDRFGRDPDFYRGSAILLGLKELTGGSSDRRLYGYRAMMALASIGARLARSDGNTEAASMLETMSSGAWKNWSEGVGKERAELNWTWIRGCVADGSLITRK